MIAIKGKFDGKHVCLPSLPFVRECSVIVIFEEDDCADTERDGWLRAQESSFSKAWDSDKDAVYDNL